MAVARNVSNLTGFVCISRIATSSDTRCPLAAEACEMYVKQIFIASVLPAPLSPDMRIDCDIESLTIWLYV